MPRRKPTTWKYKRPKAVAEEETHNLQEMGKGNTPTGSLIPGAILHHTSGVCVVLKGIPGALYNNASVCVHVSSFATAFVLLIKDIGEGGAPECLP